MESKIEQLAKILEQSNNIVFFGGAGVSTENNNKFLFIYKYKSI